MSVDHRTYFRFSLPGAMMMGVPSGVWTYGEPVVHTTIEVSRMGDVAVTCIDHSIVFAREQILMKTLAFLKSLPRLQFPETVTAQLSAPNCRERPEIHQITFDASVSITPGRAKPIVA